MIKEAHELDVKVNGEGNLTLPKELLEQLGAEEHFKTMRLGNQVVVCPASKCFHEVAMPEQRAKALRLWAESHENGPGLTSKQISRDSIYD